MQIGDWNTPAHRQGCTVWGCKWEDKRPTGTSRCFRVCLAFSCWNFLKSIQICFPSGSRVFYPFIQQKWGEKNPRWLKSKIRVTHAGKIICHNLAPRKFFLLSKCWIKKLKAWHTLIMNLVEQLVCPQVAQWTHSPRSHFHLFNDTKSSFEQTKLSCRCEITRFSHFCTCSQF